MVLDAAMIATACASSDGVMLKDRITYVLQNARYDIVDLHLYDDVVWLCFLYLILYDVM